MHMPVRARIFLQHRVKLSDQSGRTGRVRQNAKSCTLIDLQAFAHCRHNRIHITPSGRLISVCHSLRTVRVPKLQY